MINNGLWMHHLATKILRKKYLAKCGATVNYKVLIIFQDNNIDNHHQYKYIIKIYSILIKSLKIKEIVALSIHKINQWMINKHKIFHLIRIKESCHTCDMKLHRQIHHDMLWIWTDSEIKVLIKHNINNFKTKTINFSPIKKLNNQTWKIWRLKEFLKQQVL